MGDRCGALSAAPATCQDSDRGTVIAAVERLMATGGPHHNDLHKTLVYIAFATDLTSRGTTREFVVDIPARESIDLKLQATLPGGYGVVIAHALQFSGHSPFDHPVRDPTPENACAFKIANARRAPPKYVESVFTQAAGCNGQ
jgi:hypothetical protein